MSKQEFKVIDVMELNYQGINVEETSNPGAVKYFSDNGSLPSGKYKMREIQGYWVHLEGKHINEFDKYAYRAIDSSTLVPMDIFYNYFMSIDFILKSDELKNKGILSEKIQELIREEFKKYLLDVFNKTTAIDVFNFETGKWLINIHGLKNGFQVTAGKTRQDIINQPSWFEETFNQEEKRLFIKEFYKYF